MSTWTHVIGSIRFDGLPGMTPDPDCGTQCTFEDDEEQWDKCNIPCGSEGSLIVSSWRDPSGQGLARDTVTIFGDLRDYEDEQAIIDYFHRIVSGMMVRQACFSFFVEGKETRTFVYKDKKFTEVG